ncbi:hypothetical protein pdam_00021746 [Pocillopora damicornis]|uniref:Uncharacterized protein n=1 Tax=Pocillopora damicornis TaxID=46731 RepID=A0A3M6U0F6_POCDA|nr:hypothetical protein pdam_00021746 [Pocillopora damicornis]
MEQSKKWSIGDPTFGTRTIEEIKFSTGKKFNCKNQQGENFDSPRPKGHTVQNNVNRMRLMLLEALNHKGPEQKVF